MRKHLIYERHRQRSTIFFKLFNTFSFSATNYIIYFVFFSVNHLMSHVKLRHDNKLGLSGSQITINLKTDIRMRLTI